MSEPGLVIDRPAFGFRLDGATEVILDNPLGDLHVRPGGSDAIDATVFVQRWNTDTAAAVVRPQRRNGLLFLTVEPVDTPDGSRPLRADAVVTAPAGVALRLYTGFGPI